MTQEPKTLQPPEVYVVHVTIDIYDDGSWHSEPTFRNSLDRYRIARIKREIEYTVGEGL